MSHIEGDKNHGTMLGVAGTWQHAKLDAKLWYNQVFKSLARALPGDPREKVRAEIRFDARCRNGHNTFSVTGTGYSLEDYSEHGRKLSAPQWRETSGGCVHEQIAAAFPELAHLIKWHLVDTMGPMHYIANTMYHASDRDHRGLRKGEEKPLINGKTGCEYRELVAVNEPGLLKREYEKEWAGKKYVPLRAIKQDIHMGEGVVVPNPPVLRWRTEMIVGEGKERQLDFARKTAVWPEASDELLTGDPAVLKAALLSRLPALLAAFERDVRAAGFLWTPAEGSGGG